MLQTSQYKSHPEQISDRNHMFAALKTAPPMNDENVGSMPSTNQESRNPSIDYVLYDEAIIHFEVTTPHNPSTHSPRLTDPKRFVRFEIEMEIVDDNIM